jgi:GNAT superfamily N-acetyltransferase
MRCPNQERRHQHNTHPWGAFGRPSASMDSMKIEIAQECEIGTVLALIEELLVELVEEGQEFAGIDREKLHADIRRNMAVGPDSGPDCGHGSGRFLALLAKEESGAVIGVLTLSTSFALYAGGEYGVIDEMYVRPGYRCRGVGRQLVVAAMAIAHEKGWFRLDVTGPEDERGERAVHFYKKLGFEFSGPKLRLLV